MDKERGTSEQWNEFFNLKREIAYHIEEFTIPASEIVKQIKRLGELCELIHWPPTFVELFNSEDTEDHPLHYVMNCFEAKRWAVEGEGLELLCADQLSIINAFLDIGVDPLNIDESNNRPNILNTCLSVSHFDVIYALLEKNKLSLKSSTSTHRFTPLHVMARYEKVPLDLIDRMLEREVDIHALDHMGQTALHAAVNSANFKGAHHLIKRGAQIDLKDNMGKLPLDLLSDTQPDNLKSQFKELFLAVKERHELSKNIDKPKDMNLDLESVSTDLKKGTRL